MPSFPRHLITKIHSAGSDPDHGAFTIAGHGHLVDAHIHREVETELDRRLHSGLQTYCGHRARLACRSRLARKTTIAQPRCFSMKRERDVKGSDVVDPGPEVGRGQCSSFYRLLEGGPCWWEHSSWSIFY
jgi:hypothetical protein